MYKKMKWIVFATVLIASLLLSGCTVSLDKELSINDITKGKLHDVTKIVFSDGRGKNKPSTLTDKQKINEFILLLNQYILINEKEHSDKVGWIHRAVFYKGDQKIVSIVFTNPITINEKYYDIVKGNLSTERLDTFIMSVNSTWTKR